MGRYGLLVCLGGIRLEYMVCYDKCEYGYFGW